MITECNPVEKLEIPANVYLCLQQLGDLQLEMPRLKSNTSPNSLNIGQAEAKKV